MKKSVKIALIVTGIVVLMTVSYFLFLKKDSKIYLFKDGGEEDFVKDADQSPETHTPAPAPVPYSSSSSSSNPFDSKAEIMKFQQWVISHKKDTTILGSAGADGLWGRNTSKAFAKYGKEYNQGSDVFQSLLRNLGNSSGVSSHSGFIRAVFGDGMFIARFYDNKRILIWKKSTNTIVLKGNWYDGGLRLISTEGRNKGQTFQNPHIWENLKGIVNYGTVLQQRKSYDDSWYKLQANRIYDKLMGWTTEVEKQAAITSLKMLKTDRDWYELYEAFGKKPDTNMKIMDIRGWLNYELSNGERYSINKNWKAKGMQRKLYSTYN